MIELEVSGLESERAGVRVLNGISFSMSQDSVGVLGLNGSGKSTLLRTIVGITRPTKGKLIWQGATINGLPAHRIIRLGIGFMPQNSQLFAGMSVRDNLRIGGYLIPKADLDDRIEEQLERFAVLRSKWRQRAEVLSGGQRQLLALAKVLIQRPKLLLLDEPSGGLSPRAADEIYAVLRGLHMEGMPILLAEQNVPAALDICDSIAILHIGRLHAMRKAKDLRESDSLLRSLLLGENVGSSS